MHVRSGRGRLRPHGRRLLAAAPRECAGSHPQPGWVALTPAGKRADRAIRRARAELMESALDPLTAAERTQLDRLLAKVLAGLEGAPDAVRGTCRLCDTGVCGRAEGRCSFWPGAAG